MARRASSTCARSIDDAVAATSQLFKEHERRARRRDCPTRVPPIVADRDRLMQVHAQPALERGEVLRAAGSGRVEIAPARRRRQRCASTCATTAPASAPRDQAVIFEKFRQVGDTLTGKPHGHRARLADQPRRSSSTSAAGSGWRARPGAGATFSFTLPLRGGRRRSRGVRRA